MKETVFSNEDISAICSELLYLLHAGIGNADALTLLAEDESRPGYKKVLESMAQKADEGAELSETFRTSGRFPEYICRMLEVSEKTGRIEEALSALAGSCGRRADMERRLKSALLYPSVLLLIMLAVIAVLLVYVLPIFNSVYAQLGGSLSGIAGGLLDFGKALGRAMPVLLAVFCGAVIVLVLFSVSPAFREKVISDRQRNKGDRGYAAKVSAALFAQGLSMGMSSGMTAEEAVEAAAGLIEDNPSAEAKAQSCLAQLNAGSNTADALRESGLIPASQCRILDAGVRGGAGEQAMEQIAEKLTEESEIAIEDSLSRVEPTMVIIASVLVGLILLSVMLPLINIMSAIG